MVRVLYRAETIKKIVDLAFCTHQLVRIEPSIILDNKPLVGDDDTYYTYIQLDCIPDGSPEKRFLINGYLGYVDPVRCWHTIQLLKEVGSITSRRALQILIMAAMRGACEQDMREALDILKYGICSYNTAMSQQVPTEIARIVLACYELLGRDKLAMRSCFYTITGEIEVGTMQLTPQLREAGVRTKAYYQERKTKRLEIVKKYTIFKKLDRDYIPASHLGLVSWNVYDLIERGIEDEHGTRICAMLAVLRAIRAWDSEESIVNGLYYRNNPEGQPTLEQRVGEIISLLSPDREEILQDFDAFEALVETLMTLYESIDSMPVVHELVTID